MPSQPLKYIFMGSPPLASTILATLSRQLYLPVAVVTQEPKAVGRGQKVIPTSVEAAAKGLGLPVHYELSEIQSYAPDLILVAAFGKILREETLKLPRLFALNVHASLLPKYRGASPIQRAIWNGDATTGITIQKMAKKLDTGDILLQKETPILPGETSGELMDRLAILGGEALVEAVQLVESGNYSFVPQNDAEATYAAKLEKEDALLDWTRPAKALQNQVRALQPWPVAESRLGGVRLRIFGTEVAPGQKGLSPGDTSTDAKSFLKVQCGDGQALSLTMIQLENRKKLEIKDFLGAYRGSFPHRRME